MAVYRGMSFRMCALALATVFVVFVSMEVGQVQAQSCDQQTILTALQACLGLTTLPAQGSACCNSFDFVRNSIKPSDSCICGIASSSLVAELGLSADKIKAVITACVGVSAVPECM